MEADRTELHDLAAQHPERVADMARQYDAWAKRCGVIDREKIVALMESQGVTRAFWEKPQDVTADGRVLRPDSATTGDRGVDALRTQCASTSRGSRRTDDLIPIGACTFTMGNDGADAVAG